MRDPKFLAVFVLWVLLLVSGCAAFVPGKTAALSSQSKETVALEYVAPDMSGVTEESCLDTARRMQRLPVSVPSSIHKDEKVGVSFVHWPADPKTKQTNKNNVPVILIHGFDSSCLEYRRLGSRLAAEGYDTYAVDLLGWGFTQLDGVETFSADAKVAALNSFTNEIFASNGKKFCIAGASLGGAAAIEVAATNPNCAGLILLDAQGFVDGIGPMSMMPKPVAKLGVEVLKSVPLRSSANQMSYFDKKTYATDEAVVIGRVHCLRDGWSDALVSFMRSGGFSPSTKLALVTCPSLVLWGRQDGILEGNVLVPKFLKALPDAEMKWIEDCGHVPHLEQPVETAESISNFVKSRVVTASSAVIIRTEEPVGFGAMGWIGVVASASAAAAAASTVVVGQQAGFFLRILRTLHANPGI